MQTQTFDAIFICPDQMKLERDKDVARRKALRTKKTSDPSGDWIIKGSRILRRAELSQSKPR